jgi:hypothetical protein
MTCFIFFTSKSRSATLSALVLTGNPLLPCIYGALYSFRCTKTVCHIRRVTFQQLQPCDHPASSPHRRGSSCAPKSGCGVVVECLAVFYRIRCRSTGFVKLINWELKTTKGVDISENVQTNPSNGANPECSQGRRQSARVGDYVSQAVK